MFQRNGHLLYKRLIEYLFPTVIMALALSMSIVVDGIIVGNMLGPTALAAVNLVLPVTLFFSLISLCFGIGGTILTAFELGRKNTDRANEVFTVSLVSLAVCGFVVLGILLACVNPLVAVMSGGDQELERLVREFLEVLVWGAPVLIFASGCVFFIRTDGQPRLAAMVLVVANVINLVGDVILIHLLGGIRGASLATVLGYALGSLILIRYIRSPARTLHLVKCAGVFFSRFFAIIKAGFPSTVDGGLLFLKILCINSIVLSLAGASGMAAFSVCLSCLSLVSTFITGGADTMIPIIGVLHGEGDVHGIRLVFRRSLTIILAATIALMVLFELFPAQLLAIFGVTDEAGLAVGIPAIRLFALSFAGTGFSYLMMAYYQTVGRPVLATLVTLIQGFLVVIPAAWLMSGIWGLDGVWYAFILAEIASIIFIYLAVFLEAKRSANKVEGLLLLPQAESDDGTLDLTIRSSIGEAVGLSEKIHLFCQSHGVDDSTSHKVALAVEEMAVNVAKHGHDIPGRNYIDIGMRLLPDEIRISFRDDGRPFNPLGYTVVKDEATGAIVGGVSLLKAFALKISYTYALNFNSTLITVPRLSGGVDV